MVYGARRLTRNVYLELTFAVFLVAVLFGSVYWTYASWLTVWSGGFGAVEGQRAVWTDLRLGGFLASLVSTTILSSLVLDLYSYMVVRLVVKLAAGLWQLPFRLTAGSWESIKMPEAELQKVQLMLVDVVKQVNSAMATDREAVSRRLEVFELRLNTLDAGMATLAANMVKAAKHIQRHKLRLIALEPEVIPPKTAEQLLAEEQAKAEALQQELLEMRQAMAELKRQQQQQVQQAPAAVQPTAVV